MGDNINMTADEFCDHWTEWCSMEVSVKEAALLNQVLINILTTFEERGSPTHHRMVFKPPGAPGRHRIYESPDIRTEAT